MLGHIRQHQIGGDGCDLHQSGFAPLALDVIFTGITETTVGLQAGLGRMPCSFGRQQLGHVDFRRASLPCSKQSTGFAQKQIGGLGLGLSIIRGFVVAQGGEIVAGENPGGGAVFTVYLPYAPHGDVPTE